MRLPLEQPVSSFAVTALMVLVLLPAASRRVGVVVLSGEERNDVGRTTGPGGARTAPSGADHAPRRDRRGPWQPRRVVRRGRCRQDPIGGGSRRVRDRRGRGGGMGDVLEQWCGAAVDVARPPVDGRRAG